MLLADHGFKLVRHRRERGLVAFDGGFDSSDHFRMIGPAFVGLAGVGFDIEEQRHVMRRWLRFTVSSLCDEVCFP